MPTHPTPSPAQGRRRAAPAWRWGDLRFLLVLLLPALTLLGVWTQPAEAALRAALIYLAIALIELAWPGGRRSPDPAPGPTSPYFAWVVRLYAPLQLVLQASAAWVAWHSDWTVALGLAFAVGMVAGAQGITLAHELGHSPRRLDRILAWTLMASVGYAHFMVEHYRGHHPRAATYEDPASARFGESLWRFMPRTLGGSFLNGWKLEARRLNQFHLSWGHSPLAWASLLTVFVLLVMLIAVAIKLLVFWLLQAALAVWLLETVNYIEHYGLNRPSRNGWREPFAPEHAWNADHVVTNSLLINLQRHSDHHINPWKPYASLEALPAAPQLPTGYAGCVLLAAVPPLWFALIHPRLERLHRRSYQDDAPTQPSAMGDLS